MRYTEVARIKSQSDPTKDYGVNVDEHGELSCQCKRWIFRHHKVPGFQCKHIQEYLSGVPNGQVPKNKIPKRTVKTINISEIKTDTLESITDYL